MGDDQHGRAHELSIKIYQHKTFPFEPFEISGKLAPGKPRRNGKGCGWGWGGVANSILTEINPSHERTAMAGCAGSDTVVHPEPHASVAVESRRGRESSVSAMELPHSVGCTPGTRGAQKLIYYNPSLDSNAVKVALGIPGVQFLVMFYHPPCVSIYFGNLSTTAKGPPATTPANSARPRVQSEF